MSTANASTKKDSFFLYLAITFIFGFIAGAGFAVYKLTPATPGQATSHSSSPSSQELQAIANLEARVAATPESHESWTQLGHLYFDTNQYEKAIDAYTRSLSLHEGGADIWTDLGVMYRRTQRPEEAIKAFDTAIAMDPTHQVSRTNKGIVLLFDLKDTQGAIATWEGLLAINPDATVANGDAIRDIIAQLRQDQNTHVKP